MGEEDGRAAEELAWVPLRQDLQALERLQELKAREEKARSALKEAEKTHEQVGEKGGFTRRLEGRRQAKEARGILDEAAKERRTLPSERALTEQIGKRYNALGDGQRHQLEKQLSPMQLKLARTAGREVAKTIEKSMNPDRGRGMER